MRLLGKKMFIGLMGVKNDGKTLVSPSGKVLFKVPKPIARIIQRIQHRIAYLTH
jgi:hypothetical protein